MSPPAKPYIKILAVEDLKNDTIVANIKKELSPHILFGKKECAKTKKSHGEEVDVKLEKPETVDEVPKERKRGPKAEKLSIERMKRFLSMTKDSIGDSQKKPLACERDISLIKVPVDTIRCQNCGVLYERVKRREHLSQCKKLPRKVRYGCTSCSFVDTNIQEVQNHIKLNHRR